MGLFWTFCTLGRVKSPLVDKLFMRKRRRRGEEQEELANKFQPPFQGLS